MWGLVYTLFSQVASSTTSAEVIDKVCEMVGIQNVGFSLYLRGIFEMEPWRTLGSQEGADGGVFTMKPSGHLAFTYPKTLNSLSYKLISFEVYFGSGLIGGASGPRVKYADMSAKADDDLKVYNFKHLNAIELIITHSLISLHVSSCRSKPALPSLSSTLRPGWQVWMPVGSQSISKGLRRTGTSQSRLRPQWTTSMSSEHLRTWITMFLLKDFMFFTCELHVFV